MSPSSKGRYISLSLCWPGCHTASRHPEEETLFIPTGRGLLASRPFARRPSIQLPCFVFPPNAAICSFLSVFGESIIHLESHRVCLCQRSQSMSTWRQQRRLSLTSSRRVSSLQFTSYARSFFSSLHPRRSIPIPFECLLFGWLWCPPVFHIENDVSFYKLRSQSI
ncbi:hypothetical protein DL96DRAFT_1082297 [Flagelloscypha sp. PMI_526]|nr:hypothetical protein DL96DRAFT_1082297 [Flagelloscypha sp. PMI_526]